MPSKKPLTVIGRAERISLVDSNIERVPAKVDSGADISSIWASSINESADGLSFCLFGPGSSHYTGDVISLKPGEYQLKMIENSFGVAEKRYVVKLWIIVNKRKIKAAFTLANRSAKVYPVLLGRRTLSGKFLVDVTQGEPLLKQEKDKLRQLHVEMSERDD